MPIYTYQCDKCKASKDDYRMVDERHNGPECCGGTMSLKIRPVQVAPVLGGGDFQGYMCPGTDKWITSRRERRNVMAKHDLVETGDRGNDRGKMASGFYPGESRE